MMARTNYLLDNFALAELAKGAKMKQSARDWFDATPLDRISISRLAIADIGLGAFKLSKTDEHGAKAISGWIETIMRDHKDRVINSDRPVSTHYTRNLAKAMHASMECGLTATMALVHELTLVTPYPKEYQGFEVPIHNPWSDEN